LKLLNTGMFGEDVSSDIPEAEEKGLHPICDGMDVPMPLDKPIVVCAQVAFWESPTNGALSGISQCLGGGLSSTVEINEDIDLKGFGMIVFYSRLDGGLE
jgi:hypothetical protein